jgi:hypothetical protein
MLMFEQPAPLRTGKRDSPRRDTLIDLHDEYTADADTLHGFEVGGDAFARDVAVKPEPIDPRARPVWRVSEPGFQRLRSCTATTREREQTKEHTE